MINGIKAVILVSLVLILVSKLCFAQSVHIPAREIILYPGMPAVNAEDLAVIYPQPPDADILRTYASIQPLRPYHWIVSPGELFKVTVSCDDSTVDRCMFTVLDWELHPVAIVRSRSPYAENITFRVKGRGTYLLLLDGYKDGKCKWRLARSFASCPPNNSKRRFWDTKDIWIGQVSIPGRQFFTTSDGRFAHPPGLTEDESADLDAELVARMGVSVSRIDMPVVRTDQTGMKLDFNKADRCMKMFTSRGLKIDLQLSVPYGEGMGPILPHYNTLYPWIYPITDKPFRYYINETVKRYLKHLKFVQVNNEPDNPPMFGGTVDEFVTMVKQVNEEVKRIDPSMQITNGGYCQAKPERTSAIVPQVKGLTDFVSYHCHSDLPGLKKEYARIVSLHQEAGYVSPKFAITEMGVLLENVCIEKFSTCIEMQKLLYCFAHGNSGIMLYSSRELDSPRQHANEYGYVDYYFCPRFVYGTVSAFLDHYAGMHPYRILKESDNLHVYLFKDNSKILAAVFAAKTPTTVRLTSKAKKVSIIDPMGNTKDAGKDGVIQIEAADYPKTVVFYGADDVNIAE